MREKPDRTVRIYVHSGMKRRAEAGSHSFLNKLEAVLQSAGFEVRFHCNDDIESEARELDHSGFHIRWMQGPMNDRGLTIRRNYIDPFWKIEKTGGRWDWPVAKKTFDPSTIDPFRAARFAAQLRERVFSESPDVSASRGYVLVPLQGRLFQHRSFQSCSPLQMVAALLKHERKRNIVLTLHPGERYSELELEAIEDFCTGDARVTVSSLDTKRLVQSCDYVVAENSSVALWGFLHQKPAILFAGIDFHHIALKASERTLEGAIDRVGEHRPDYDRYIWWFFQEQSINAKKAEAENRIGRRLRYHGWPL